MALTELDRSFANWWTPWYDLWLGDEIGLELRFNGIYLSLGRWDDRWIRGVGIEWSLVD